MSTSRTREKADGELFKSTGIDDNATSNAVTIDSSGSVLAGKTAADSIGTDGIEIDGTNARLMVTRNNNEPLVLNRRGSDGDIAIFRKDSTAVGSIQSRGGTVTSLILDPRSSGCGLSGTSNAVMPTSNTGAIGDTNTSMDLGASGYSFRNAYLSGGVVFGPASASNVSSQTLDSYEEGTFTPTIVGGTLTITTINKASYIKVGNIVHINLYITLANNGSSTNITFGGLPFAAAAGIYGTGVVTHSAGANSTETLYARANEGSPAQMQIYKGKSNSVVQTEVDGGWFITSLSYRV